MKKRTAFIGAILSLLPIGQPILIKTGLVVSSAGLTLSVPEGVFAKDANYYFQRAYKKAERGDHYGAISDYTKVIEFNPKDAEAYYNRGISKDELKDYYGAISDYTKAIELNPRDGILYKNRSISKENIGDIQGACIDAKKAVSLGDNSSDNKSWIKDNC